MEELKILVILLTSLVATFVYFYIMKIEELLLM